MISEYVRGFIIWGILLLMTCPPIRAVITFLVASLFLILLTGLVLLLVWFIREHHGKE